MSNTIILPHGDAFDEIYSDACDLLDADSATEFYDLLRALPLDAATKARLEAAVNAYAGEQGQHEFRVGYALGRAAAMQDMISLN